MILFKSGCKWLFPDKFVKLQSPVFSEEHGGSASIPPWVYTFNFIKICHYTIVWYEEEYPNLLFAKDGELYTLNGLNYLAIGGAYSVDKHLRLRRGAGWWEDEQPSDEIKWYVEEQIRTHRVDVILSHTCPRKYTPTEVFLPMVDQSTVDNCTEIWLDKIEEAVNYKAWYCGHWHTDKRIDRMHFLYRTFESEEEMG